MNRPVLTVTVELGQDARGPFIEATVTEPGAEEGDPVGHGRVRAHRVFSNNVGEVILRALDNYRGAGGCDWEPGDAAELERMIDADSWLWQRIDGKTPAQA